MHQINDAALYTLSTKTKKTGRFGKAHHEWRSLEAQEGPQTSKGPIIQSVAQQRNNCSSIFKGKSPQQRRH